MWCTSAIHGTPARRLRTHIHSHPLTNNENIFHIPRFGTNSIQECIMAFSGPSASLLLGWLWIMMIHSIPFTCTWWDGANHNNKGEMAVIQFWADHEISPIRPTFPNGIPSWNFFVALLINKLRYLCCTICNPHSTGRHGVERLAWHTHQWLEGEGRTSRVGYPS